jgi:hypothetical protein
MKSLAIVVFGSIALAYMFTLARADDLPSGVSRAHLASMGLAGMQPMSDAEGGKKCAAIGRSSVRRDRLAFRSVP